MRLETILQENNQAQPFPHYKVIERMLSLSACMGFSQCLDNFLLLGRDRKLSESRGIPVDVLDVGNRKLSYVTYQPLRYFSAVSNKRIRLTP